MILAATLTILFATQSPKVGPSTSYTKDVSDDAMMVLNVLGKIGSAAWEGWGELESEQGQRILKDVRTRAASLEIKNCQLSKDLQESIDHHTQTVFPIHARVKELKDEIDAITDQLLRFGTEVDTTSPDSYQTREVMGNESSAKGVALKNLEENWTHGDYYPALRRLKDADKNLKTLLTADTCLLNSLPQKKPACDADLKPLNPSKEH